jgi:type I restriction-modification system DNA methylase subunit
MSQANKQALAGKSLGTFYTPKKLCHVVAMAISVPTFSDPSVYAVCRPAVCMAL